MGSGRWCARPPGRSPLAACMPAPPSPTRPPHRGQRPTTPISSARGMPPPRTDARPGRGRGGSGSPWCRRERSGLRPETRLCWPGCRRRHCGSTPPHSASCGRWASTRSAVSCGCRRRASPRVFRRSWPDGWRSFPGPAPSRSRRRTVRNCRRRPMPSTFRWQRGTRFGRRSMPSSSGWSSHAWCRSPRGAMACSRCRCGWSEPPGCSPWRPRRS